MICKEESETVRNILRRNYWRSAMPRAAGASRPIRRFSELATRESLRVRSVLDFGAGNQRDMGFCVGEFHEYTPHDQHAGFGCVQPSSVLEKRYDVVSIVYVLNVIVKDDRVPVVDFILRKLEQKSTIVIAVRMTDELREVRESWMAFEDGFVTSRLTYQHFYTPSEVLRSLDGYAKNTTHLGRGTFIVFPN